MGKTREETLEYTRNWHKENRKKPGVAETINASTRAYYEANKTEIARKTKANRDAINARVRWRYHNEPGYKEKVNGIRALRAWKNSSRRP